MPEGRTYFEKVLAELGTAFGGLDRASGTVHRGAWRRAAEQVVFRELAAHDARGLLLVELTRGQPASQWLLGKEPRTIAAVLTIIASLTGGDAARPVPQGTFDEPVSVAEVAEVAEVAG